MSDKPDLKVLEFPKKAEPAEPPKNLSDRLKHVVELLGKDDEISKTLNSATRGVIVLDIPGGMTCTIQLGDLSYTELVGILAEAQFGLQFNRRFVSK